MADYLVHILPDGDDVFFPATGVGIFPATEDGEHAARLATAPTALSAAAEDATGVNAARLETDAAKALPASATELIEQADGLIVDAVGK